jgi:hypothetical protein
MPWLLRILAERVAMAVWRALFRRGGWGFLVAIGTLWGGTQSAHDHAPVFADAMAVTIAQFTAAAVFAVAVTVIGIVLYRRWASGSTLYERIHAEALGTTVAEVRKLWAAERKEALRQGAEPWTDDRIRR